MITMENNTEYQIYIGCLDYDLHDEIVSEDELREMVVRFFEREDVDFSMFSAKGGYLREDGEFISENSLCINIIGSDDTAIIKLAKSLAMFMNQERSLVIKNVIKTEFV